MLIDSPRITPADRAAWARWEAMDRRMAQAMAGRLDRLADTARQIIADFAEQGPCYASISWGKDSVIVAHLVATSGLPIPLAYATSADVPGRIPNPDSERVRDAFLARFPNVDYREYRCGLGRLGEMVGTERYISGLRGAESGQREKTMRWHGVATKRVCRPIIGWGDAELWAYLKLHDLPIHPAYAMTMGGTLDRSRIRVHSFGGEDGAINGRLAWEDHYYGDITARLEGVTRARPARRK